MPNLRVNFADAQDFEVLPAGTYDVVVDETEIKEGKAGPYVKWTFVVQTGEYANRRLWLNTSTAAPGIIRNTLIALGEDIPNETADFDFDPDDYLGRSAVAIVGQRTYNDQLVNDVKRLVPSKAPSSNSKKPAAIR